MGSLAPERRSLLVGSLLPALVALPPRLAAIGAVGWNPAFFDVDSYHALAVAGLSGPVPSDYHPPGYSWFLMLLYRLVGPRPRIAYLVQALLSAAAVFLVAEIARRRWGTKAGLVAGLLLALSGYLSIFPSVLASETLCLFGVALVAFLALARMPAPASFLLAAAVAAGALATVRTGFLLFVPLLALLAVAQQPPDWRRRLPLAGALLLAGLAPLLLHASLRAGRGEGFRLGSEYDSVNFWIGNNPNATGRMEAMPEFLPGGRAEKLSNRERAALLGPEGTRYFLTHPLAELRLVAERASYLFAPAKRDLLWLYGMGWAGEKPAALVRFVYAWVAASVPLLVLFALAGWWRRGDEATIGWALLFVAAGALPYLASIGDARYLQPLHPLLALVAGAAAAPGAGRIPRWRSSIVALLAILFLANAAYDLAVTQPALEQLLRPGAVGRPIPYVFAR